MSASHKDGGFVSSAAAIRIRKPPPTRMALPLPSGKRAESAPARKPPQIVEPPPLPTARPDEEPPDAGHLYVQREKNLVVIPHLNVQLSAHKGTIDVDDVAGTEPLWHVEHSDGATLGTFSDGARARRYAEGIARVGEFGMRWKTAGTVEERRPEELDIPLIARRYPNSIRLRMDPEAPCHLTAGGTVVIGRVSTDILAEVMRFIAFIRGGWRTKRPSPSSLAIHINAAGVAGVDEFGDAKWFVPSEKLESVYPADGGVYLATDDALQFVRLPAVPLPAPLDELIVAAANGTVTAG